MSSRALRTIPQKEGANKGKVRGRGEARPPGHRDQFGWDTTNGKPKEETRKKLHKK